MPPAWEFSPPTQSLPHNIEAEQVVLGSMLSDNRTIETIAELLVPDAFFDRIHADIYGAIVEQAAAGRHVSRVTLASHFAHDRPIDHVTGPVRVLDYVERLANGWGTITRTPPQDCAREILECHKQRQLIEAATAIIDRALNRERVVDILDDHEVTLGEITGRTGAERVELTLKIGADAFIDGVQAAYARGTGLAGLSTGLAGLDAVVGGLAPKMLLIIAARPAMGKSGLGVSSIALNVASGGVPVGVFSLEMGASEVAGRALAQTTGLDLSDLRRGLIDDEAMRKLVLAARDFDKLPLHIDESGGLTIAQLTIRARRMKRRHNIGLMVVDYLQLLQGTARRSGNRVAEVTEITAGLKALAIELDIPIIAISQLSRQVESREDKRPLLSDLRESGSIEQDADVVMFVYRDEYYVARQMPEKDTVEYDDWLRTMREVEGVVEIIIAKHRHGPCSAAVLHFDRKTVMFRDPTEVMAP